MARSIEAMVSGIRSYSREHYNEGGWDVIEECWDDEEIAEEIVKHIPNPTMSKVLEYFKHSCKLWDSVRRDVQGEIF